MKPLRRCACRPRSGKPTVDSLGGGWRSKYIVAHGVKLHGGANTTAGKGLKANARAFLERISRNYDEGVDGIALFQTDTAVIDPQLKEMLGPLLSRPGDAEAVGELLAAARKKQPQLSESEHWFGLDNHSLLPQLTGSPRWSLETI